MSPELYGAVGGRAALRRVAVSPRPIRRRLRRASLHASPADSASLDVRVLFAVRELITDVLQ